MLLSLLTLCAVSGFLVADQNSQFDERAEYTSVGDAALEFLLLRDREKCTLKLVCSVGANLSEYANGPYVDQIASSFGYVYKPFDFSVVENPFLLKNLQEKAENSTTDDEELESRHHDNAIFIRTHQPWRKNNFSWLRITPSGVKPSMEIYRTPVSTMYWKPIPVTMNVVTPNVSLSTLNVTKFRQPPFVVQKLGLPAKNVSNYVRPAPIGKDRVSPPASNVTKFVRIPAVVRVLTIVQKIVPAALNDTKFGGTEPIVPEMSLPDENRTDVEPADVMGEVKIPLNVTRNFTKLGRVVQEDDAKLTPVTEDVLQERQIMKYSAGYIFNRAFVAGLRGGLDICSSTFDGCSMDVEDIVRFSSSLFSSPNVSN